MDAVGVFEQLWVPIHVEDIEEGTNTVIIDPKDPIIELSGTIGIIVEQLLQLGSPMSQIELRIVAPPSKMGPRVLQF